MSSRPGLPVPCGVRTAPAALGDIVEASPARSARETMQSALDGVRTLMAAGSDELTERAVAVDREGRTVTLLRLRAEHAHASAVCSAWLDRAACNHALSAQGVVPLLAYGLHGGRPAALLERRDDALPLSLLLSHLTSRQESPSLALALHVVRALCDGLATAHALTVEGAPSPLFHGDLCSEQVLVRADGRLQLAALGLWCALPAQHAYRLRAGRQSAAHLPPEQAHGLAADARGDVYALGVLLRQLVQGVHDAGTGDTRLTIEPAARMLIMLLGRLLAAAPEARLGSIEALRGALDRLPHHAAGEIVLAQLHADVRGGVQSPTRPVGGRGCEATALLVAPRPSARGRSYAEPLREAATAPHRRTSRPQAFAQSAWSRRTSIPPPPPVMAPPAPVPLRSRLPQARCTLPGPAPLDDFTPAAHADVAPALASSVAQRIRVKAKARQTLRDRWQDASETVFMPKARALTRFVTTRSCGSKLALALGTLTVVLMLAAAWLLIRLLD